MIWFSLSLSLHLKRICKDAFRVAGAVQKTCSSEMLGGQGADFLRGVAFWSIRSVGLLKWFCVIGAALRMTWHHFFVAGAVLSTGGLEKTQNALVQGRQRCSQLSIFEGSRIALFLMLSRVKNEEVSQNCFVFDVVKFKNWEVSQNLLRFGCCHVQKLRKSRRIVSFLTLLRSKMKEVSQNFRRFWCCQLWKMKTSRRIASFSSLQIDRQTGRQTDRYR